MYVPRRFAPTPAAITGISGRLRVERLAAFVWITWPESVECASLRTMKLKTAAELVEERIAETLTYYAFPRSHWIKLKTNNPMERLLKEVRRRTKVVGAFPDGHSALMLVAARLRHVSATNWGTRVYMNMRLLEEQHKEAAYSAA